MNLKQKLVQIFIFSFILFSAFSVYAQAANDTGNFKTTYSGVEDSIKKYLCTPGTDTFAGCINKMYRVAIAFGATIAVFFIVIAGYIYMSAGGDSEGVTKAKSILETSITAMVILMGGYVLLKALNPDIVDLTKPIQPPQIKDMAQNSILGSPLGNATVNHLQDIINAGCTFQNPTQTQADIVLVSPVLFQDVIQICQAGHAGNRLIQISSVAQGTHTPGSYHYKYCAVDFADGTGKFMENPAGIAAAAKASSPSIGLRVNPGTDEDKINHLHVDMYTSCPNK